MMYGVYPYFILQLIVTITVIIALWCSITYLLRKWLNISKESLLSNHQLNNEYNHINWSIRILFLLIMITGFVINLERDPFERFKFLEPFFLLFIYLLVSQITGAFIQWKYIGNRNVAIYILSRLFLVIAFIISFIITNAWGLF
ncbi:protein of unknown function [Gracilibacillus kekensis]|uniref:DUF4181 domain-containing protein n=2 Tax=Gracilibacillus kekensis TaxID=1027249 RepID=A0A1M7IZA9_9BACI|nr:protein of unknown function [Gracilibacillus kekensis]